MKKGFITGRFQPFHLGHLSAIKQALEEVDFLYIGIGSAQYSRTEDNPYTAEERGQIIRGGLLENGIPENRFQVIPIPDIHDNAAWPAHVHSLVPPFDIVFVGDDGLVKELFEKYDKIPVKIVDIKVPIRATHIRKMMKKGEKWKKWVPKATALFIKQSDPRI
ncbi:nicotinamide-nucleotide adenylyltransferase [Candidatus Peregrinibacteria bacterium]|nr:nicotinamide-nucleotide adenylyltransferase [Candidatus Peregrinibacteria bacterium]